MRRLGRRAAGEFEHAGLSRREFEVLRLVPVGRTNREIAAPVGKHPYQRGPIAGFVQPPGSAEAGWQLCERVVDSE